MAGEATSRRYPHLRVAGLRSSNPLALVAAVRLELRRAGIAPDVIEDFTREALESGDLERARSACSRWVEVEGGGSWA
jgi:hypothetical protein